MHHYVNISKTDGALKARIVDLNLTSGIFLATVDKKCSLTFFWLLCFINSMLNDHGLDGDDKHQN